jgi:sirohydrochlorin ferrochelatase
MKVALIDNGSLKAEAHDCLRAVAASIEERAGTRITPVSWKHSDRTGGTGAWTLAPWIHSNVSDGERDFVLIPFFISPKGAIGSALRRDLAVLQEEMGGFEFSFAGGLTHSALATIIAERVRETAEINGLQKPSVIVVDHGGPSPASAAVRNRVADAARDLLWGDIGMLTAASMESPDGDDFAFNRPLLADALASPGLELNDVVIAPLFLSPGRHAGDDGDLARIVREAQARAPALRCHFTELVGTHPSVAPRLASNLLKALRADAHP